MQGGNLDLKISEGGADVFRQFLPLLWFLLSGPPFQFLYLVSTGYKIFCQGIHHFLGWQTKNSWLKNAEGTRFSYRFPAVSFLHADSIKAKAIPVSKFLTPWLAEHSANLLGSNFNCHNFSVSIHNQVTGLGGNPKVPKASTKEHAGENSHLIRHSWRKTVDGKGHGKVDPCYQGSKLSVSKRDL